VPLLDEEGRNPADKSKVDGEERRQHRDAGDGAAEQSAREQVAPVRGLLHRCLRHWHIGHADGGIGNDATRPFNVGDNLLRLFHATSRRKPSGRLTHRLAQEPYNERAGAGDDEHPPPAVMGNDQPAEECREKEGSIDEEVQDGPETSSPCGGNELAQRAVANDDFRAHAHTHHEPEENQPVHRR
jgi:hypothetical protein